MEKENNLLKIAAILYGIIGAVFYTFTPYGIFLLVAAIFTYVESKKTYQEIYKNRVLHYIVSIIGIANIIGSIIVLIYLDEVKKKVHREEINAPPKVIYKTSKESKKIDLLLKLGVGMIFISGLLFATTSWSFLNNYIKAFALVIFATLFLGLSIFTEEKLKLYRSSYMYWLLSMSLFILTIVGVLYFGIFGEYLTYTGPGSKLAYAITLLTGAGFSLTTYYKFPKKYLLYTCYGLLFASFANFLSYMSLSPMLNLSIITLIVMTMNIFFSEKKSISIFSSILSYILFGFLLIAPHKEEYEIAIAGVLNVLNLNVLTFLPKKEKEPILSVILTYFILLFTIMKISILGDYRILLIGLTTTIYALLINGKVLKTKKWLERTSYVFYTIVMTFFYLIAINTVNFSIPITYVLLPIILLGMNTLVQYGLFHVEKWNYANYIQPFFIFCVINSLIIFFHHPITLAAEVVIVSIIYCLLTILSKNRLDKQIGFVYFTCAAVVYHLQDENFYSPIPSLLYILPCLFLMIDCYRKQEDRLGSNIRLVTSYVLLLTSMYSALVLENLLNINVYFPSFLLIGFIFIFANMIKNKKLEITSYIYIILPLLNLVEISSFDLEVERVLTSLVGLYLCFLLNKYFIKNSLATNITSIIGLVLFIFDPLFTDGILTGIYVGVIGIIYIIIGFQKDELSPIFTAGIILTIVNIIYRLKEVWTLLPFWLYLLVGGLAIIGFVTYREMKKQEVKEEPKK